MDVWKLHQLAAVVPMTAWVVWSFRKQAGVWAFLWMWCLVSGALVFLNPEPRPFTAFPGKLDEQSAIGFAFVLLVPIFVSLLNPISARRVLQAIEVLCVLDAILLLYDPNGGRVGFWNAHSMDTAMMAMAVPFMIASPLSIFHGGSDVRILFRACSLVLVVFCIFRLGGSAGIAALLVSGACYAFTSRKLKAFLLLPAIPIAALAFTSRAELISDSGRFEPWGRYLSSWAEECSRLQGCGIGTFHWLGYEWANGQDVAFLFMHNEPLQLLIEGGYIGLFLAVVAGAVTLARATNVPWVFACFGAMAPVLLTQYPFRFLISAIWIVVMIRVANEPQFQQKPGRAA